MSEVKTNKISSLASNNDITIDPDGTGNTIIASGNVGIGTSSPSETLHVEESTTGNAVRVSKGGNYIVMGGSGSGTQYVKGYEGTIAFGNAFAGNTTFLTGDTERMRIQSNGFVLIATTTSGGEGYSFGNTGFLTHARASGAAQSMVGYKNGGSFVGEIRTSTTATSYITSSDYRLKENVTYDWDATTRLKQLKPARFNFIIDPDKTVDGFFGT